MPIAVPAPPLRVAIVGGGPGGLSAAIALSALENVEVTVYEQARELREVGAGISIGPNTWRVLRLLDVDKSLTTGHITGEVQQRDGKTGEILSSRLPPASTDGPQPIRTQRTALQQALLAHVSEGTIKLRKRLTSISDLDERGVELSFEDGEKVVADLLIGADGIRSVVREAVFPHHGIKFTGRTIWRVLQPISIIPPQYTEFVQATAWWHGPGGHFYYSEVGEGKWEIAAHGLEDPALSNVGKVSWGVDVSNAKVESNFTEYHPFVRDMIKLVPEGQWREFSAFAGKELDRIVQWDKVALVGDSSHPLSGAFGSGAGFAIEDGYILAKAVDYYRSRHDRAFITKGLDLFDSIRSPYYARMYEHLGAQKAKGERLKAQADQSWEGLVRAKVKPGDGESLSWIYDNDIAKVWEDAVRQL